jgi:hypothetical protein
MYLLAASSLRKGGWFDRAQQAVDRATSIDPEDNLALQEKKIIANMQKQLRSYI